MDIKPTTEEISKAQQQGYNCAQAGINTHANTYRNHGHWLLFEAWLKGHESYHPAVVTG